jgi:arginase family enzyme
VAVPIARPRDLYTAAVTEIPHTTPGRWPEEIPQSRFAAHVHQALRAGCRVAMIGLADDLGVRLNGGRPGAREGPRAFREALARYGVAQPHGWDWPVVLDAGDIMPAAGSDEATLLETHRRVTEAVAAILDLGLFPIGIGGGHDLTFPFVRAVARKHGLRAGVYFDAHLDVRETAGSGMAFRRLIEECGIRALDLIGFQPMVNAREHVEWFLAHGGRSDSADAPDQFFVSLDLDVLDAASAPGVSAPSPAGLLADRDLLPRLMFLARHPGCRCFDLMELCPPHDEGGRTARLAAHLFLSFLRGFAERPT